MPAADHSGPQPAIFDRHVLSLDVAGFAQSLAERGSEWTSEAPWGAGGGEETDHRHLLLLRRGNTRQSYRGAKRGNEAPTVHSSILMQPQPREKLAQSDTAAGR